MRTGHQRKTEEARGWGAGSEKNRGAVDIFGNIEFPVSPETENSHWLKGGRSVITLTTADHDCLQAASCGLLELSSLLTCCDL